MTEIGERKSRAKGIEQPSNGLPARRHWSWTSRELGVQDPLPLQDLTAFWGILARIATIGMGVVVFGVFLFLARSLLVPILSALVVMLTLGPLSARAERLGAPAWLPATAIVALFAIVFYLAAVLLAEPISDFIGRSAEIGALLKDRLRFLQRPLAMLHDLQNAFGTGGTMSVEVNQTPGMIGSVVTTLTPAVMEFVLFFGTLFFFIIGRKAMRRYIVNLFGTRDSRLRALKIFNDTERNLSGYLITVTLINLCVGVMATVVTMLLGFPAPLLWGALAFALNYIPYVGPGLMHITLFVVGLLTFPDLPRALIAPLFFLCFTFLEGHVIMPAIIGRQLLLHPLAVFLSLAFWAWLWGPMGAFLATPILIMAMVALDHLYPQSKQTLPE